MAIFPHPLNTMFTQPLQRTRSRNTSQTSDSLLLHTFSIAEAFKTYFGNPFRNPVISCEYLTLFHPKRLLLGRLPHANLKAGRSHTLNLDLAVHGDPSRNFVADVLQMFTINTQKRVENTSKTCCERLRKLMRRPPKLVAEIPKHGAASP